MNVKQDQMNVIENKPLFSELVLVIQESLFHWCVVRSKILENLHEVIFGIHANCAAFHDTMRTLKLCWSREVRIFLIVLPLPKELANVYSDTQAHRCTFSQDDVFISELFLCIPNFVNTRSVKYWRPRTQPIPDDLWGNEKAWSHLQITPILCGGTLLR